MKILIVFGTRPEAIKMSPLVKELQKRSGIELTVCVTAQHRKMLDQVLEVFDIVPNIDLDIMKPGQSLFDITTGILNKIEIILKDKSPDVVLVHGDTTTAMVTALAAFYMQIPVGHVEAGLRTFDIKSPWPEEGNRQIIDSLSSFLFAPTSLSKEYLLSEGIKENMICVTGNTVIDALLLVREDIYKTEDNILKVIQGAGYSISKNRKYILITGHRRENFGDGFRNIGKALIELATKYSDIDFVYPVHLNPNVRSVIFEMISDYKNIYLIEPQEYLPFVYLLDNSYFVLTDSGGIQEEAPSLGKPVLVMRSTTERPEAVEAGTVKLVGTEQKAIVKEVSHLLDDQSHYKMMSLAHNPYGDGLACKRIADFLDGLKNE